MKVLRVLLASALSVSLLILPGCATTSKIASNISLGMEPQEVIAKSGRPFSKNVYLDNDGNHMEEWSYKETTWDDGGWSWDKTIINTVMIFENNKLKSFGNAGERFKTKNPFSKNVSVDASIHHD